MEDGSNEVVNRDAVSERKARAVSNRNILFYLETVGPLVLHAQAEGTSDQILRLHGVARLPSKVPIFPISRQMK